MADSLEGPLKVEDGHTIVHETLPVSPIGARELIDIHAWRESDQEQRATINALRAELYAERERVEGILKRRALEWTQKDMRVASVLIDALGSVSAHALEDGNHE